MVEWTDPRYAELVAAWRRTQRLAAEVDPASRPVRIFVVPPRG